MSEHESEAILALTAQRRRSEQAADARALMRERMLETLIAYGREPSPAHERDLRGAVAGLWAAEDEAHTLLVERVTSIVTAPQLTILEQIAALAKQVEKLSAEVVRVLNRLDPPEGAAE